MNIYNLGEHNYSRSDQWRLQHRRQIQCTQEKKINEYKVKGDTHMTREDFVGKGEQGEIHLSDVDRNTRKKSWMEQLYTKTLLK